MAGLTQTLLIIVIVYACLLLFVYIYQGKLIFFPPQPNILRYQQWKNNELLIKSGADILQCWRISNNQCSNNYTLVYFGGNAEDVSGNLPVVSSYNIREIYFVNLSGYGNSTGTPSEKSFYANGLDVYDYLIQKQKVDPGSIIIMGRSLGSAVAIYINAKRTARALILVTPFDKLTTLVPETLKRLFPLSLILRHKFDNLKYLDSIKNKILILAASHDEVIPVSSTMTLHKMCNGSAQCTVIDDTNHQTISNEVYFQEINNFLETI